MAEVALVMPKMSMTMTDGEVLSWNKKAGDTVGAGDVVCEVMTDKVDMEVESPVSGTLVRVVASVGDQVLVGAPLAFIESVSGGLLDGLLGAEPPSQPGPESDPASLSGESLPGDSLPEEHSSPGDSLPEEHSQLTTPPSRKARIPALPGARRKAGELGIELADLTGTGPDGAISISDVELASKAPATQAPAQASSTQAVAQDKPVQAAVPATPSTSAPVQAAASTFATADHQSDDSADPAFARALDARRSALRKAVARAMQASAQIPQFTVWADLDLSEPALRRGKISWTTVLIAAFSRALAAHPFPGVMAEQPDGVCVAMAVDTPIGLLGPVLTKADSASLTDLDDAVRSAARRARAGQLSAGDLTGASTTFSNLGGWGVDQFNALLTPGQASALSVGAVRERPVIRGGGLGVAPSCRVGLTVDHTQADGADAARVLEEMTLLLSRHVANLLSQ